MRRYRFCTLIAELYEHRNGALLVHDSQASLVRLRMFEKTYSIGLWGGSTSGSWRGSREREDKILLTVYHAQEIRSACSMFSLFWEIVHLISHSNGACLCPRNSREGLASSAAIPTPPSGRELSPLIIDAGRLACSATIRAKLLIETPASSMLIS